MSADKDRPGTEPDVIVGAPFKSAALQLLFGLTSCVMELDTGVPAVSETLWLAEAANTGGMAARRPAITTTPRKPNLCGRARKPMKASKKRKHRRSNGIKINFDHQVPALNKS
ncbi:MULTISPECIES: hypothetical protein [Alphaproteobacteria]|uniref:Uncharacterized protein n=2 Tax=Alphaproteobacteria TaxID=28211 RepID=A0A512HCQ4_9HYPH|nr:MULTISPECIES: hypothetical protein [Alphaproteobacteria]GEO83241.1 hypothetical protein RNA01_01730 [Ciceribacter naphthalenivorans]GLR20364.1 hypothetical protein GCM10007920_01480 [Ciceribacter naphthalenivorans]GLT03220.1 hypothetical protein GCM10007926_01480 [Sphingomonas psychrolutea]